jgi:hypothetical protein
VCRLEHLAKKFKHKADIHEAWTSGKEEMLSSQVLKQKTSPPYQCSGSESVSFLASRILIC